MTMTARGASLLSALIDFLTAPGDEKHEPDQQADGDEKTERPADTGAPIFYRVRSVGIGCGNVIARAPGGPRDERRSARVGLARHAFDDAARFVVAVLAL